MPLAGLVSGLGAEPNEEAASVLSLETLIICSGNPHSGSPSHPREPVPTLPAPQESWVLIARATRGDASLNLGFPFLAPDTQDLGAGFSVCFEIIGDSLNVCSGERGLT